MSRDARIMALLPAVVLTLAALIDGALFVWLVSGSGLDAGVWLASHGLVALIGAAALAVWLEHIASCARAGRARRFALCAAMSLTLPFVGIVGAALALSLGTRAAARRHREADYWQFTPQPELPYVTPPRRSLRAPDGRGFAEQLTFGSDADALYGKVLSAGRMPATLSVDALNAGIRHPEERIRLTAYQTLDRAVNRLNDDIDRLEGVARSLSNQASSDAWLQVASNYWELLTLEQGEPVARAQLLDKAASAAQRAIAAREDNRNAHFTLGRIALRQGRAALAEAALARAGELGMPGSTTLPYRAEAAFVRRDFGQVSALLGDIAGAFTRYPPLRQVTEQWQ